MSLLIICRSTCQWVIWPPSSLKFLSTSLPLDLAKWKIFKLSQKIGVQTPDSLFAKCWLTFIIVGPGCGVLWGTTFRTALLPAGPSFIILIFERPRINQRNKLFLTPEVQWNWILLIFQYLGFRDGGKPDCLTSLLQRSGMLFFSYVQAYLWNGRMENPTIFQDRRRSHYIGITTDFVLKTFYKD